MQKAYIIDAVRTAIGKLGGGLSSIRADDMLAFVISGLMARNKNIDFASIEDVIIGCANQAGEDNRNIARMSSLLAGLPTTIPGQTINRLCASGMSAIVSAGHAINANEGELFIAGGVEHMTRAPYVLSKGDKPFSRNQEMFDTSIGWRFVNNKMREKFGLDSMGETAENVAEKYSISREDQDKFATLSQEKAAAAQRRGRFQKEILPIEIPQTSSVFQKDEFIRPETSIDVLSTLKPAFKKNGTVTAGNSSGINDGACVLLLASEEAIKKYGLRPKAEIIASAQVGVEPRIMGMGPVDATKKVLNRSGLSLDKIEVLELNEAFAAQSLACIRELGLSDNDSRINPNGGAIALGHPLGMSGARLVATAMYELEEKNKEYALCTMCVGVGQGTAIIIKRYS
jgi:acetyl-CoA acyltransferase